MKNPIQKRSYYAIEVELCSPLCVSSGKSIYTDSDVIRNGNGEVFVPGTSIAGALRNYLGDAKNEKSIMGFSNGNDGRMSSIFISDLYFDHSNSQGPLVSVRDGVKLQENKIVENKFDMQIIETGAKGTLYLQCVERMKDAENTNGVDFERTVYSLIQAIQNGEIRFGAKKNRGFGRMKVHTILRREFTAGDVEQWIREQENYKQSEFYTIKETYETWFAQNKEKLGECKYVHIRVPLKLAGGISIRKYSTKPGEADFEHITCDGKPVIPGSSLSGAIRSDALKILNTLMREPECVRDMMDCCFGHVGEKTAYQSMVVIAESVIDHAVKIPVTRNCINRFDASTKDGALYSEIAYFGGSTTLEILIRKDENDSMSWQAVLGLLKLVISDIQKGYLAVGGQTAVGRGIFESNGEIECSEDVTDDICFSALYSCCME